MSIIIWSFSIDRTGIKDCLLPFFSLKNSMKPNLSKTLTSLLTDLKSRPKILPSS